MSSIEEEHDARARRWLATATRRNGAVTPLARAQWEAIAIDQLADGLRLESFRTFLRETVHSMSALVPEALEIMGFEIDKALDLLRPSRSWLSNPAAAVPLRRRRRGGGASKGWTPGFELWGRHPFRLIGDAVIREGALGDYLLLAVVGASVEIHLNGIGHQIATRAGTAQLILNRQLPEIVALSCVGRPLDDIVSHALLRGRGCVVTECLQSEERSVLTFQVGERALLTRRYGRRGSADT